MIPDWRLFCKLLKKIIPMLSASLVCWSCEEMITINLNAENPKIVIESFITNGENPVMVKITKSQAFFNQSNFTPVKNAVVQLEYLSVKDKLLEKGNGYYLSSKTRGIAGRAYTLKVVADGETYGATVELPPPVPIDNVYFQSGLFQSDSLNIVVEFLDPAKTENYYRLKLYRNGRYAVNDYYLMTDAFANGEKIVAPVYYRYFAPGDTVVVELLNLERCTWKYYKGMSESVQQGINSQAPGNPPTNLSGGALGIFGAGGSSVYRIIIPCNSVKK
jgi:hypothetical protein